MAGCPAYLSQNLSFPSRQTAIPNLWLEQIPIRPQRELCLKGLHTLRKSTPGYTLATLSLIINIHTLPLQPPETTLLFQFPPLKSFQWCKMCQILDQSKERPGGSLKRELLSEHEANLSFRSIIQQLRTWTYTVSSYKRRCVIRFEKLVELFAFTFGSLVLTLSKSSH